jgi:Ca-activated chloride channel family protein
MSFAHPDFLWLLALLPALAWLFWRAAQQKRLLMTRFIPERLLAGLLAGYSAKREQWRWALILAALACLVVAAARPRFGYGWEEARQRGLDIMVAVDTSRSMLADDVKPNRLQRARLAALDLVRQARSDRLGLVAFAGSAFLQCPLTLDEEAFRQNLNLLDPSIIPQGGTALAQAIETAVEAYKGIGDDIKVLVIFTDGEDHEEGALEAAERAAKAGIRIFTVGVGTAEGEKIRLTDAQGKSTPLLGDDGQPVLSRLNTALLEKVATAAGGFYLPLTGAGTIEMLYERGLAPLPKVEFNTRMVKQYHERFQWPLALGLLLLVVEALLPHRIRPRIPSAALAALWLLAATLPASGSVTEAQRWFKEGKYATAREEYERLIREKPADPKLRYNAGVAAFKAGDFTAAANHFLQAQNSPQDLPLQQKAFYNAGNARFREGEQAEGMAEKRQLWEQSLQQYEGALKLNGKDGDAQFNIDWVKKKLEELKQQEEQQKQSGDGDKSDDKNQDQQKQQDQKQKPDDKQDQKQDSSKQDSESKSGQDQKQSDSKDGQKPGSEKKPGEQKPEPGKESEKKDGQEKKEPGQNSTGQTGENKPEGEGDATNAMGQTQVIMMTPDQARQLLDIQRWEERPLIFKPPPDSDQKSKSRLFRDW